MHLHIPKFIALGLACALVTACGDETQAEETPSTPAVTKSQSRTSIDHYWAHHIQTQTPLASPARWYTSEQLERGNALFATHCASCHGAKGQGVFTWRQRDANAKLPPPPLNGTGHAWHHPLQALRYQIKFGARGGSGTMPPFENTLTDAQITDTIAWFQSHWSDDIYRAWMQRQPPKK
jgi:mono/diheme cytochrome c family protein